MTEYTIKEFREAIERLDRPTPEADQLPQPYGYAGFREQSFRWLDEYLTPGHYDRQNFVDDARTVYQRLNNGRMIVWINEAAGENSRIIQAAIAAMDGRDSSQAEAKYARRVLPWDGLAKLLFD